MAGKLLYKPSSEKDGRLAVLADTNAPITLRSPQGQVIASGKNYGASNGYAGTYRFDRPGGRYPQGTQLYVGDSAYKLGNTGARHENPQLLSGSGNVLNMTASAGGGGGSTMINLAPFEQQLGLGSGMPAGYTAVPGQEKAFRKSNEQLFNKFSDMYDPAIQGYLQDLDRSRLNYIQGAGTGDIGQEMVLPEGLDLASGSSMTAMRNRGSQFGQAQSMNASDSMSRDELERVGRNLDALQIGKGMEKSTNTGLAGLARIASSGAISLGDVEFSSQLQKMGHDAKLEIAGIENSVAQKLGNFDDDMDYYNIARPLINKGIDWAFEQYYQ